MNEDNGAVNRVNASLGSLSLEVQGEDEEWVSEEFDEKLEDLLEEAEDMSKAIRDGDRRFE